MARPQGKVTARLGGKLMARLIWPALLFACALASTRVGHSAGLIDAWSAVTAFAIPDGHMVAAIHAALLPSGDIELMGKATSSSDSLSLFGLPFAGSWTVPATLPAAVTLTPQAVPYKAPWAPYVAGQLYYFESVFCGGGTFTSGGDLHVSGGSGLYADASHFVLGAFGLTYNSRFSSAAGTWSLEPGVFLNGGGDPLGTILPNGAPVKWYPTALSLHDGSILTIGGSWAQFLVFSGSTATAVYLRNKTIERQALDGTRSLISTHTQTPDEVYNRIYTYADEAPDGQIVMVGEASQPVRLMMGTTATFTVSTARRPTAVAGDVPNARGVSVLTLPWRLVDGDRGYSNGSFVTAGGVIGTSHAHSLDVYDYASDTYRRFDLGVERESPSLVNLPDGRVLIAGGYSSAGDPNALKAEYFDPSTGTLTWGQTPAAMVRAYHTSHALLNDGRVLFFAGQPTVESASNDEATSAQAFSPDYLSQAGGVTAWVLDAPTASTGHTTGLYWLGSGTLTEAILMANPSTTHGLDMHQRVVQVTVGATTVIGGVINHTVLTLPSSALAVPPGPYRLFVLDRNRIPSVGLPVQVGP